MRHHLIDRYSHLESPIHKLDPRAKLLGIFILLFSTVLLRDLTSCLLSLTISISLLLMTRIPLRFVFEQLKYGLIFIFAISITMFIFGHEPFKVFLRATSALILIFVAFSTSRFDVSIKALNGIGFPNILTQILMFTYRYIFVLAEEYEKLSTSLKLKNFEWKTSKRTLETVGKLIATLFIRSYERSENVYKAMIMRGYTGLSLMTDFKMGKYDLLFVATTLYLAIALHICLLWRFQI